MNTMNHALLLLCILSSAVAVLSLHVKSSKQRYVVWPGLDADPEETAQWSNGHASPINVLFGHKPYVIGWVGDQEPEPEPEEPWTAEDVEEESGNKKVETPGKQNTSNRQQA